VTKIVKSKYKICRRLGASLWGSAKDPVHTRNFPPGQHGLLGQKRKTVHGIQLQAKQKLKGHYNITEKQFKNLYLKARQQKGNVTENFVGLLERRLDAVVYRLNFAPTIFSARQLITHKHILVNGKKLNIPSYLVSPNDVIELKKSSQQIPICMEATQKQERAIPSYLSFDIKKMQGSFITVPTLADIPYATVMEPHFVVEFYSK